MTDISKERPRLKLRMPRITIAGDGEGLEIDGRISYTASLITQGTHRFYTLSMPSDVLAETCMVDRRDDDPENGFQRLLDINRAREIAAYIDKGFGTIPSSIVLSAQPEAGLSYKRVTKSVSFAKIDRSFLILDGQHRVFGFRLAESKLRVPVVIYNGLTKEQETRIFIDINTKQRPVPNELLLDIKRLAMTENKAEALFREVFDAFNTRSDSPLFGLLSPAEKKKGKLSRVTFNGAMKAIVETFSGSDADQLYDVLSAYISACISSLRQLGMEQSITNPTVFRSLMLLFPEVAERVADRYDRNFSSTNFDEVLAPALQRVKKSSIQSPGTSYISLHEAMSKNLRQGFTIAAG